MKTQFCILLIFALSSFANVSLINTNSNLQFNAFTSIFQQQAVIANINYAISTGNASELAKYFYSSVELFIPKAQGTYSKNQTEILMKNFFETNPPTSFNLLNQGSSADNKSHFVLANYKTQNKTFRIYYLLKEFDNKQYITTLKFE